MAHNLGVPVGEVVSSGPGLTFIAYPAALAELPLAPLWSFLFFTMILTLGLDTQFGMTEAVTSAIMDQWPNTRRHVMATVFAVCTVCCALGLPFCLNGGVFIFELVSWYSALWSLVVLALLEVICVAWMYGTQPFIANLAEMGIFLGFSSHYWKFTWRCISPLLLLLIFLVSILSFSPAYYDDYVFPPTIQYAGWVLSSIPILPVLGVAIWQGCRLGSEAFKNKNWGPHQ